MTCKFACLGLKFGIGEMLVAERYCCPLRILRRNLVEHLPQRLQGSRIAALSVLPHCAHCDLRCTLCRMCCGHGKWPNLSSSEIQSQCKSRSQKDCKNPC